MGGACEACDNVINHRNGNRLKAPETETEVKSAMNSLTSSAIGSDKTCIQMMKAVSLNALEALTHLENQERGVLQGSCLGPIRFNIYTSELVSRAARHIYTLMIPHKTTYRKYSDGGLGVTFGGGSLSICDKIKTLGVVLDSELSFADHVSYNMRDYRNPTHAVFRYKFSIIVTLHMGNMTLRYVFAMRRKDHVSQYRDAVNILRMGKFCKLFTQTAGLTKSSYSGTAVSGRGLAACQPRPEASLLQFREQGGWVRVALGGEGEGVSEGGYWRLNISRQCSAVLRGEELCLRYKF
ncbi:hypothetical protein J6590_049377 [Homalodisca vitripennis]|nr:hypothetical protein J6590_049377 [Homalodisca vitripennis]